MHLVVKPIDSWSSSGGTHLRISPRNTFTRNRRNYLGNTINENVLEKAKEIGHRLLVEPTFESLHPTNTFTRNGRAYLGNTINENVPEKAKEIRSHHLVEPTFESLHPTNTLTRNGNMPAYSTRIVKQETVCKGRRVQWSEETGHELAWAGLDRVGLLVVMRALVKLGD
ncbi:unnamed protein product [Protopolystoma xenopodis]|uniref:Uncharacterized protein n=1 Tax=Protopolystoma xenopodis TaxID=117903 RepID=A0A448WX66_9PLAT|nr:unnamed protein product [Protopolystoma xenopodis]